MDRERGLINFSPTISTISSSDFDTESTGSFFPDEGNTLGALMGVSRPSITIGARGEIHITTVNNRNRERRRIAGNERSPENRCRRGNRWWQLCRDDTGGTTSLGNFLEVERHGLTTHSSINGFLHGTMTDNVTVPARNRRIFVDGRVLPPPVFVPKRSSSWNVRICRGGDEVVNSAVFLRNRPS